MMSTLDRHGNLIRQLQGALGGNRVIRGTVADTGAVIAGSGFHAVRNSTGDYTITFDDAFATTPSVKVGAGSTSVFYAAKISGTGPATKTGFGVFCWITNTLAATDGEFHFVAIG